jgi:predicted HTH transcriptional regulator
MADLLDTVRKQINARRAELRPLAEEAAQLERALDALGGTQTTAAGSRQRTTRRVRSASRQRRGATVRGQTGQRIIEYVKAHPDSTASDVAKALGLQRNSTSTRLAQLAKARELTKAKRGYSAAR